MKVKFWGACGSLPASINTQDIRKRLLYALNKAQGQNFASDDDALRWMEHNLPFWVHATYGVATPCIEIITDTKDFILCDAGTGLRDFAHHFDKNPKNREKRHTFHIFLSHLHWDHIQGFPFFTPAFRAGNKIIIHGYHEDTEKAFKTMMSEPFFPVPFQAMQAEIIFDIRKPCEDFIIDDFVVKGIKQQHPGISYGYRFEYKNKSIVYSTDCEHQEDALSENYPFHHFFKDTDILIMDGQYQFAESNWEKENWGHSSNIMCVELASLCKAKHLVLFHFEPTMSDEQLDAFFKATQNYFSLYTEKHKGEFPKKISFAQAGLVLKA